MLSFNRSGRLHSSLTESAFPALPVTGCIVTHNTPVQWQNLHIDAYCITGKKQLWNVPGMICTSGNKYKVYLWLKSVDLYCILVWYSFANIVLKFQIKKYCG